MKFVWPGRCAVDRILPFVPFGVSVASAAMLSFSVIFRPRSSVPEITVTPVSATDRSEWSRLVEETPGSTFFQRWEWRSLLCDELGYLDRYRAARCDGRMVGLLPLVEVRSPLFGRNLTSLPFCSYAGPLVADAPFDEPSREQAKHALVEAAVELGRSTGATHVELRSLVPIDPDVPRQSLYSTFRAPLPEDLDSMKGIPQKRRNMVRKAVSAGLQADVGRDADRFFEMYAENARAHGTPALGRNFFRAVLAAFPEHCDVLYVTDKDGRDLSAILSFYHAGEVLAYFAGEVEAARTTSANDFKYWSLMRHARSRGCGRFDFGRSKAGTGSFRFKELWGFEAQQLHYEFPFLPSGRVPQNNPSNPKYRLAIESWRRLPRAIVDRVGPIVVRGLG
jgi:FemAB-related protein (PEP-CTERM system-associated)